MKANGYLPSVHRKKLQGRPMARLTEQAPRPGLGALRQPV
jgi:hypothetical protein